MEYVTYRLSKIITDVRYVKNSLMFRIGGNKLFLNMNPKRSHLGMWNACSPANLIQIQSRPNSSNKTKECLLIFLIYLWS